jgi:DNA-binding MarR family transcriptional regulator
MLLMATEPTETPETPAAPDAALLAAFERRVLTRDEPPVPEPLRFDAASVQARIGAALGQHLRQRDPLRQRSLAGICYRFLAAPTQFSAAPELAGALGLSASALVRTWRELHAAGLVEAVPAGRRRCYRLSRAGEDWLLAVVKGEAPAV